MGTIDNTHTTSVKSPPFCHKHFKTTRCNYVKRFLVLGVLQLLLNLRQHIASHSIHIVLLLPAPISTSMAIIERVRPRVGNGLSAIRLVVDGEVRHVLLDVLGNLSRSEGHSSDVVHTLSQLAAISLDELQSSTQTIGHVHHGQRSIGAQEASVVVMLDSLIEDINSIICGTTARQSLVGDDSRISAATEIESSSTMIILSQQLQMHLRHSVHCGGSHDSLIRSHLLRS